MDFEQLLKQRYTTKHYDNTRKVPDETITKILECVRLTPTSVNAQPRFWSASVSPQPRLTLSRTTSTS